MGLPMALLNKVLSSPHNYYGYQSTEIQNGEFADYRHLKKYTTLIRCLSNTQLLSTGYTLSHIRRRNQPMMNKFKILLDN
jgi:hypothetical protein